MSKECSVFGFSLLHHDLTSFPFWLVYGFLFIHYIYGQTSSNYRM